MTRSELLEEIKKLSAKERLDVIEAAIHTLQEDFGEKDDRKQRLAKAAEALLKDYEDDKELISFTALDGEAFYE